MSYYDFLVVEKFSYHHLVTCSPVELLSDVFESCNGVCSHWLNLIRDVMLPPQPRYQAKHRLLWSDFFFVQSLKLFQNKPQIIK